MPTDHFALNGIRSAIGWSTLSSVTQHSVLLADILVLVTVRHQQLTSRLLPKDFPIRRRRFLLMVALPPTLNRLAMLTLMLPGKTVYQQQQGINVFLIC